MEPISCQLNHTNRSTSFCTQVTQEQCLSSRLAQQEKPSEAMIASEGFVSFGLNGEEEYVAKTSPDDAPSNHH